MCDKDKTKMTKKYTVYLFISESNPRPSRCKPGLLTTLLLCTTMIINMHIRYA